MKNVAIIALVCTALCSGCATVESRPEIPSETPPTAMEESPNSPNFETQNLSHRWTADPGISLESVELQAVRAFQESEDFYYSSGSVHPTYSGFIDAAPYNVAETTEAFPRTGTIHNHVIDVSTLTDRIGRDVTRVTFCEDRSNIAEPTQNTWTVRDPGSSITVIIVTRTDSPIVVPTLDLSTRTAHPNWNTLQGWAIEQSVDFDDWFFDISDPLDQNLVDYCTNMLRRSEPLAFPGDILTTAPEVEPFTPGWPTALDTTTG
ncbi:hypothetical protein ACFWCF_13995 [Rhodococcus sp. NPDC060090]|uniref:hypothetical protein n=1 Tax=Rhodococcus sp. NPDC060090 TaxID=3347056 RepID=UPI003659F9A5